MAGTITESTAVLRERAAKVGLPEATVDQLVRQGVDTLAKLAFAAGQPGETPTDAKLKTLVQEIRPDGTAGPNPSLGTMAAIRHLVFESQTLVVNETKNLVESREEQAKELPPAERRERVANQAARLQGLRLAGPAECSYASYDLCLKLISDNAISYLAPSKFISRQDELRLEKPKKELDVAQSGSSLVVRDRAAEQSCDVTTALSLHHALQRRALAMDLVGLSTFGRAQSWNDFLMSHLEEQPMAGFMATSLQQVLQADRAAWLRLAEILTQGVRKDGAGNLPLDAQWDDLQVDPKVVFHLLPIPNRGKGSTSLAHPKPDDGVEKPPAKRIRKGGKGKGKDKLAEPPNLPSELQGLSSWTRTGKRRCWSFNMACGCPTAKAGQSCPKGLHVCMRCGGMHGAANCPKKTSS